MSLWSINFDCLFCNEGFTYTSLIPRLQVTAVSGLGMRLWPCTLPRHCIPMASVVQLMVVGEGVAGEGVAGEGGN